MVSYAMPSEGSKVKHSQLSFPALPYMYCAISGFPESFHNILYDTWFLWHISHEIWHKVMSYDPALFAKTRDAPFISKYDTLTYYQFTCLL